MVETVREWAAELEEMHGRIAHRFARSEPRKRALSYLKGLTGSVERKNGWRLAEATGERTPDGMQRPLNAANWDADAVRELKPKLVASPPHLGACIKMRCDVGSCGPLHSGRGVNQALVNSTRGVPPSVSRARNLSSGVFVNWQRYGDLNLC